jgi:hypothetical protein
MIPNEIAGITMKKEVAAIDRRVAARTWKASLLILFVLYRNSGARLDPLRPLSFDCRRLSSAAAIFGRRRLAGDFSSVHIPQKRRPDAGAKTPI